MERTLSSSEQEECKQLRAGDLDSSLQGMEKGEMVWRMERGGHRSLTGEKWVMRISLFGKGNLGSFVGKISASPKQDSPWKTTDFNPTRDIKNTTGRGFGERPLSLSLVFFFSLALNPLPPLERVQAEGDTDIYRRMVEFVGRGSVLGKTTKMPVCLW